jgi:glycosyltransferase involved in cell wall biosynthesis
MQISIVLCTYNGSKYLDGQLDSLVQQSVSWDELIIIDDASTDGTVEILNRFEREHKNVKLLIKSKNAGFTHRYEEGIGVAAGDLIFLCDQDDVWEEKKLERMKDVFKETDAKLVFSDARCIDSSGDSLGYNLWDQMGFNKAERLQMMEGKGMLVTVRHNVASACCMAFHNSLKKNIQPLIHGNKHLLHDRFILAITVALYPDSVKFIDEQLVDYRIHKDQVIRLNQNQDSHGSSSRVEYYQAEANLIKQILGRVEEAVYRRGHYFWTMRSQSQKLPFLRRFIILNTLFLEGDYKRFTNNPVRSALGDLLG